MKRFFKLMMSFQVWIYRHSGSRLPGAMRGFKVLLLTTTGRKSGKLFTTPLGQFDHADGYIVVASNSGRSKNPSWYFNLKANPQVTLQVLDKIIPATAEELSGDAREQAWCQVIATAPAYAHYKKQTTRVIPLILLRPNP